MKQTRLRLFANLTVLNWLLLSLLACDSSSVTPLPVPTPEGSFTFAVFGDIRTEGRDPPTIFNKIVQRVQPIKPQAALLVGDIINADSKRAEVPLQWSSLLNALKPLASTRILPTLGNHETNGQPWAIVPYRDAFPALPANGPPQWTGYTYSLDLAPLHFVSITSEYPGKENSLGNDQLDWLEQDLKANTQPYSIVLTHDPAFPVGPHKGESLDAHPADRDRLWQLLKKYKVTAFIAGHEHLYNRSVQDGVTQLIIGTSGSPIYGGYGGDFYHYGIFTVTNEGLQAHIYDENGKERDNFLLKNSQN